MKQFNTHKNRENFLHCVLGIKAKKKTKKLGILQELVHILWNLEVDILRRRSRKLANPLYLSLSTGAKSED